MQRIVAVLALAALVGGACSKDVRAPATGDTAAAPAGDAEKLFASYQSREATFDPAAADLYCDNALIRHTRRSSDGQSRVMEIPVADYKSMIRAEMPIARAKGDYSTYSNVSYASEEGKTRITATRFSMMKKYSSPISLLVGPCASGTIGIIEEISESQQ
jgi:hypothetical protein